MGRPMGSKNKPKEKPEVEIKKVLKSDNPMARNVNKELKEAPITVTTGQKDKRYSPSTFICPYCNKEKKYEDFYKSTDPMLVTGITTMCKTCAERMARQFDPTTNKFGDVTRRSTMETLERLDKPFIEAVWEEARNAVENGAMEKGKPKSIWGQYIWIIQTRQDYKMLRWRDGDLLSSMKEEAREEIHVERRGAESKEFSADIQAEYEKNKHDVIRLLGYDPFYEENEKDKPMMYSQLLGYLDASGDNEDMIRTSSAITIVRGFVQNAKIDDMIARCMCDTTKENKAGEIKQYLDSKQKNSSTISQLAEQSCLSQKHSKNASKGDNTFTGRSRKLKELNLREAEVNAFDIGTCTGMQQVADISAASIIKQIRLDENDYVEMLAQQRELITKLITRANQSEEEARILLRENLDLKSYIEEQGIDISSMLDSQTILYEDGDTVE